MALESRDSIFTKMSRVMKTLKMKTSMETRLSRELRLKEEQQ
jgi:hypothetical protein